MSTGSGALLVVAGISGLFTLNPFSLIIQAYLIGFGLLILVTELKNVKLLKFFLTIPAKRIDTYFHLLSVPRLKGGFYCFVGILAFFSQDWNLSRICVLIVSIVGLIHLFACKRCGHRDDAEEPLPGAQGAQPIEYAAESGSCGPGGVDAGPSSWSGLMQQVVADHPEMLAAGFSAASAAASSGALRTEGSSAAPAPPS